MARQKVLVCHRMIVIVDISHVWLMAKMIVGLILQPDLMSKAPYQKALPIQQVQVQL